MARLDDDAIRAALLDLPDWAREDEAIVRTFRRRDFRDAIGLIDAIADAAEEADHHPDLCLRRYRNLEVRLTTHSAGGLTERDVALARRIDELARAEA